MYNTNQQSITIPKRAFTRPSIIAIVFFIIIVLILVPHTVTLFANGTSVQSLLLIYLSPLALPGLFCAYHAGLAVSKIVYAKQKKDVFLPFFVMIVMHIICIALCVGIEVILTGFPIKLCFDTCIEVKMVDVVIKYSLFSTLLFLPAYYAVYQYDNWYRAYVARQYGKSISVNK